MPILLLRFKSLQKHQALDYDVPAVRVNRHKARDYELAVRVAVGLTT